MQTFSPKTICGRNDSLETNHHLFTQLEQFRLFNHFEILNNLDFSFQYQHYVLVVLAQDGGASVRLSATATVYVNVVDVNDNAPVFDPLSYAAELAEDAIVGSEVVKIHATDLDAGEHSLLLFT